MAGLRLHLRPARQAECAALTALCLRSKAVHGYDADFMRACAEELAVTPKRLAQGRHLVAEAGGRLVGFAQLISDADGTWLEALFVEPGHIGKGVGRRLFDAMVTMARDQGAPALQIDADPGAEAFYLARGAVRAGRASSGSIPGRFLPRLLYDLDR